MGTSIVTVRRGFWVKRQEVRYTWLTPTHIPTETPQKIKADMKRFNLTRSCFICDLENIHWPKFWWSLDANGRCQQRKTMKHFCSLSKCYHHSPISTPTHRQRRFGGQRAVSNFLIILDLVYRAFKTVNTSPYPTPFFLQNYFLLHFLEMCYIWRRKKEVC